MAAQRYRDGDRRAARSLLAPRRSPHRLRGRAGASDRGAAAAADDSRRDRRDPRLPLSTVSLWLKRIGLGKRSRLEPPEPPNRYERRHPGELVHVDIKKLGRISSVAPATACSATAKPVAGQPSAGRKRGVTGYEYVHVMIDDHSRLAYAEVLDDLTARCAVAFLRRAVAWFAARGVHVRAVMSDNGSCYVAHELPPTPARARPAPPAHPARTGRAPTARQSASSRRSSTSGPTRRIYGSSHERTTALPRFLERYNYTRPHGSLGHQAPASRQLIAIPSVSADDAHADDVRARRRVGRGAHSPRRRDGRDRGARWAAARRR